MKYPNLHEVLKKEASSSSNLNKFDSNLNPLIHGFAIATCICNDGAIVKTIGGNESKVDEELCELHDYVIENVSIKRLM